MHGMLLVGLLISTVLTPVAWSNQDKFILTMLGILIAGLGMAI